MRSARLGAHRMQDDELYIDTPLVRRLLAAQLSQWAGLPLRPVESSGSDNVLYRLGDDMVVRLPRRSGRTEDSLDKEIAWLPRLAPQLPLAVPLPLARGRPRDGYPCRWAVFSWLEGETASFELVADPRRAALDLAAFFRSLQAIDVGGAPCPGEHNFVRGVPLAERDAAVHAAIDSLRGDLEVDAVTATWEAALRAPVWDGPPVWIHGDLNDGNLLVERGRFSGVIDWGGLAAADPACDLMVEWNFLPADAREVFRAALAVDEAMWARARGWALSVVLIATPYDRTTTPVRVAYSLRRIR
ncbi:MAG: aminoglycoside phosphotransferase family protein [Chloroflexi bacterium]|nr:aminoglycoside phosphotransferase family protein [Chloroflexota bacterium]